MIFALLMPALDCSDISLIYFIFLSLALRFRLHCFSGFRHAPLSPLMIFSFLMMMLHD